MSFGYNQEFSLWFKKLIRYYKKNYLDLLHIDNEENFISNVKDILELYGERKDRIEHFGIKVLKIFQRERQIRNKVHSYGFRLKDEYHLAEKLIRKKIEHPHLNINVENFFSEITDLAGLRILQLYKTDIKDIHNFICNYKEWSLSKPPVAYNFSPRFLKIFKELNMEVKEKTTGYSSAHYVIQNEEDCYCEIQVRTLFEEGWSEIDHTFNYPRGKPGKICTNLLASLKRICDVAVYLADQIPDIYEVERHHPDNLNDDLSMSLLQENIIENLQSELDDLKNKLRPSSTVQSEKEKGHSRMELL